MDVNFDGLLKALATLLKLASSIPDRALTAMTLVIIGGLVLLALVQAWKK